MVEVVGIRFKNAGKIYYFDPKDFDIEYKMSVIVETARGIEYGRVVVGKKEVDELQVVQPLKPVLRIATKEDDVKAEKNIEKAKEAFTVCFEKIRKHELEMKLIDSEYTFDNSKLLFYFTADGRVDFRELVKDLASVFRTRIELRQIGVRDETKMIGGVGICGRTLCCRSHLSEFSPVSIKMAKEQGLSLNPTKISGVCGRLMCCLRYEQEAYEELNENVPGVGSLVDTPEGKGVVIFTALLKQKVKVRIEKKNDTEIVEFDARDIKILKKEKVKTMDDSDGLVDEKSLKHLED